MVMALPLTKRRDSPYRLSLDGGYLRFLDLSLTPADTDPRLG